MYLLRMKMMKNNQSLHALRSIVGKPVRRTSKGFSLMMVPLEGLGLLVIHPSFLKNESSASNLSGEELW